MTEQVFQELLETGLGDLYPRALEVFRNCGSLLSFDVTNVLMHAREQGREKTEEVLGMLEEHYEKHLQFQHPDIRGNVEKLGVNPTERLFLGICQHVLNLQPTT
ncbi:MAG: hypothetical protein Q8R32_00410 [bacterium]|nr:hypothetical protein [bacterium]